ncbi:peptide-methionine (S)-S-oxide reductase MsrA [Pelagibaculum spongiae]|uniref:Peptide methionine sulfoxide reductase MsrA n=1 Tax=Pelagibaculum spongiae TaxID=2080658 RepID=A0A2V1GYV1_9GAMM|nr:peptide-methionine (S)-S-oxide reductase MsrA [Pelagibaculum spongiae]PVZ72251.1 peptide-methionine (S)-S-oxide reductase [Pelagibaculum spongiae]
MLQFLNKQQMVRPEDALPGRDTAISLNYEHFVSKNDMKKMPQGLEKTVFGMGCFWGAERLFWKLEGVWSTSVGYAAGYTPNPTYREVCSGDTGHSEVVQVFFDPKKISYQQLLKTFWENHDPTQGLRQGNDKGSQYRSIILTDSEQHLLQAESSRKDYQQALQAQGMDSVTTEIETLGVYYFAEEYHQQYLAKNPGGYCGLGGTGISCPGSSAI